MIETWSEGTSGEGMPEEMLVETLELVRAHPWWAARARLAISLLRSAGLSAPASLIDVGCGWGVNLQSLEAAGYHATGLDASRSILDLIDQPQRTLVQADLTKPLPVGHPQYDGGLMLDVLEHLDDDSAALQRVAPLIRAGGTIIVSVPALPELYSEYDAMQGHRRRYTPEALQSAFETSGFKVKAMHWWGAWMVPILRLTRKKALPGQAASKSYSHYLRIPPWPVLWMMRAFYALEGTLPVLERLPTGTSLLVVATR